MKLKVLLGAITALLFTLVSSETRAEELYIYNWTDYTSPELVEKFEAETGIDVTVDTYDSNETLLAKLKAGGGGYDIVVPTHNFVPILIEEGLIQRIDAKELSGYNNLDMQWRNPPWDEDNKYTIPWQLGSTAFTVNTDVFSGNIDSYSVLFDPPPALRGKIGMLRSPDEVISMALLYLGKPLCNENRKDLGQAYRLLKKQKPFVLVYDSDGILERLVSGDAAIHMNWSGYSQRARLQNPSLKYAYPKEGVMTWVDNIAVPKNAPNYESALKFVEFMMRPENAAIQTNFAGYNNGVAGSMEFVDEGLRKSPEINPTVDHKKVFTYNCSDKAIRFYDKIWTRLLE